MTLPDERYRAMVEGLKLIKALIDPQATPRVPKAIRARARWILRHYPGSYDLEAIAVDVPSILSLTNFNGEKIT